MEKATEGEERGQEAVSSQALLAALPDGVITYGADGHCRSVNQAAADLLGLSLEGLLGQNFHEISSWKDSGLLARAEETMRTGIACRWETPFTSTADKSLWLDFRLERVDLAGAPTLLLIFSDISERIHAQKDLRESEARFRALIENVSDLITIVDGRGNVLFESPSCERFAGYRPEEVVGQNIFDGYLHPDDIQKVQEVFAATMQEAGLTSPVLEARFLHADGSWRTMEMVGRSLKEPSGELVAVVNSRDITERKRAEAALRESEEQLRQAQKMEAVGQLAGGIAHDFNNVLTAILGYSEMILASEACPPGPLRADVEEIKAAGDRASALTRQILAFSRRQALRPEVLSLNDALVSTELLLRRTLGEEIDLISKLDPDLGLVEVDINQFEQVLVNLALNARDAMPIGGALTLETKNVELDQEYCLRHAEARPGPCVMLAVSDTGVGMDEETKSHIFEPFFTTKEPGKGTGLGLATVYGIVKQSDGNIFVYSEPGAGSTFKLYLPRVDKPAKKRVRSPRLPGSVAGNETVLVVEDETAVRELVRRVLGQLGYTVLTAGSADEALTFLEKADSPIDLLLTDVVLPGSLQGNELARAASAFWPRLPVLYMSGYTRDAIVHSGRLDEGVNYLEKPFTPDQLAGRVREVIDSQPSPG
jgi:PAS domain S-box-containing protein